MLRLWKIAQQAQFDLFKRDWEVIWKTTRQESSVTQASSPTSHAANVSCPQFSFWVALALLPAPATRSSAPDPAPSPHPAEAPPAPQGDWEELSRWVCRTRHQGHPAAGNSRALLHLTGHKISPEYLVLFSILGRGMSVGDGYCRRDSSNTSSTTAKRQMLSVLYLSNSG